LLAAVVFEVLACIRPTRQSPVRAALA